MGNKIDVSIEEILERVPTLIITYEDIDYIFKTESIAKQFYRLYYLYSKGSYDISVMEDFLKDNKEEINKENLILIVAKNCRYQLQGIEDKIREIENRPANTLDERSEKLVELNESTKRKDLTERVLKEVIRIGRSLDKILVYPIYNEEERRFQLNVVDSAEYLNGKHISKSKKIKRFGQIDEQIKDDNNENKGLNVILKFVKLQELVQILPSNDNLINSLSEIIYKNNILRTKQISVGELEKLRNTDVETYKKLIENIDYSEELKNILEELIAYVNIDKLLLTAAHNIQDILNNIENGTDQVEQLLKVLLSNIENKNEKITYQLGDEEKIYSVKDIEKLLRQFIDGRYISNEHIEEYRRQVEMKQKNLTDFDERYIDLMFSKEELEAKSILTLENLEYVANKLGWDKDKILQVINSKKLCSTELLNGLIVNQIIESKDIVNLYLNGKITIEQIEDIKNMLNLSEAVNSYELIQYYKNSIEKDSTEEEKDKFNKYLELYKEVLIKGIEEEPLEENQNNLVDTLLDNFNGEEYIKVAEDYYTKGLLTLEILVEWNEEKIIDRFYNDSVITLEDIEELVKKNKLSFEYISSVYKELASKENIEYDERLKYISTGYIPEEEIFRMYEKGFIFEKDLRNLAEKGIVRIDATEKLINNRTKEDLEKHSSIRLIGLNELTKINNEIYLSDEEIEERKREYTIDTMQSKKPKLIIDPNKRAEYINLFNAYEAVTDLQEDSPFYNYKFYVIPDESGDIGLNSVVIAERYYEDKDSEERFALNNATYFFRYKDLMVLSNLKKSEMTKERENVVFTVKHILADENKNGYWAAGVIYGIAKTMLSSDLKEYSKAQQRKIVLAKLNQVYSNDEILKILAMASDIDYGEYTYEIVDPKDSVLRKLNNRTESHITDDTESR